MKLSSKVNKRLQSKAVWMGVLSQVLLITVLVNPHVADTIKIVGGAVIESATLFGFLNNPDNTDEF